MTERERLIELLDSADTCYMQKSNPEPRYFSAFVADYLIANAVRLPVTCGECKYGEKQGEVVGYHCEKTIVWRMGNDFCSHGEGRADNEARN